MKKALFTLAILVMAFGNMGFAQSKAEMRAKTTERVFKQYGLVRQSSIVPQQATYSEVDGTQHRTTYYYDEYEFTLSEEVVETYYDNWTNEARALYEYDFNGNVLEAIMQQWSDGDWEDEMKMSCEYDGDLLSEVIYQNNLGGGIWMNVSKEVYNYNGDTWTVLYWMWNGTTWSSDMLYTYTRSGNTIELLMQYMEGGAWQNEGKEIYTLDFDDNVTEIVSQVWADNEWVNSEQTTYLFENGVFTDKYIKEWDGSAWVNDYHFTYEYDVNGNAKHGECYAYGGYDWGLADNDIEMAFDYNATSTNYYGCRVDVELVDLTGLDENVQTVSFMVYPMPAENEIQIQAEGFQKAEIYSLTGQKLMESTTESMNVSALSQGVYLLKVYDQAGKAETQRIVVK